MKNVSISLTDQHAAEIEAQVASGDFASVSEVIRAALREFLARGATPGNAQIDADIEAYLSARDAGDPLVPVRDVRTRVRAALTS